MIRFGASQIFHPDIKDNRFAKLFLKIFGNQETGSSYLHFMRTVRKLSLNKNSKVLDAGCGKGKYSFWLSQKYPAMLIDACDLSGENIAYCKECQRHLNTNCNFFIHNLLELIKPNYYDLIFSNHVIEHIADNKKVLHNFILSLKPGGYIYIQIPNATQNRLFSEKFIDNFRKWEENEHIGQDLTLSSLASLLEKANYNILLAKHISGFWGELSFELKEIALSYLNNKVLYAILFPFLKLFGYIDSLVDYKTGNGILVLAQKKSG